MALKKKEEKKTAVDIQKEKEREALQSQAISKLYKNKKQIDNSRNNSRSIPQK